MLENADWSMVILVTVLLAFFIYCFGEQIFIRPFKKGSGRDIIKK